MKGHDLSIVILAGRSVPALHATLLSVDRAVREAGPLSVEILLQPESGAPNLHDGMASVAGCSELRLLAARAPGHMRRDAVAEATGAILAVLDAGDLWSSNMLSLGLAAIRREGSRHSVWRPEAVIDGGLDYFSFDTRTVLQSPMVELKEGATLLYECPFASAFILHRAVLEAVPMPVPDRADDAFDADAWWIADCVAAGHAQRILAGTVLYRWNPQCPVQRPVRIGASALFAMASKDPP